MNKSKLIEELFNELLGEAIHGGPMDDPSKTGSAESIYGRTDKTKHPKMDERELGGPLKSFTYTVDSIPMPEVSELGWADASTTAKGKAINPNRVEISSYLKNIEGTTLQEKLASIQEVIENGFSENSTVNQVLSHLVFLKTLTFIVQNFNASSSGFTFESFLGVLLGGKQVPTGQDTIADLISGTGEYVSLKLLTEGSTSVEGSYTQLIKDLKSDKTGGKMKYVVALKDFDGEGTNAQGRVSVYDFVIDRNSLSDIMKLNKPSQECFRLISKEDRRKLYDPRKGDEFEEVRLQRDEYMQALVDGIASGNKKLKKNVLDLAKKLMKADFAAAIKKKPADKEYFQELFKDYANNLTIEELGLDPVGSQARTRVAKELDEKKRNVNADEYLYGLGGDVLDRLWNDHHGIGIGKDGRKTKGVVKTKAQALADMKSSFAKNLMSFEESMRELEGMSDKDYYEHIEKYSFGVVATKQFAVTQDKMKSAVETHGASLGSLSIGKDSIIKAMQTAKSDLDKIMFAILGEMNQLSKSLREFFVNGLSTSKGEEAKTHANTVGKQTSAAMGMLKGKGR
ncbi:MAG: hypothetical protein CMD83_18075 [Gammaproteobacteria bacterium]|nr:hypothetical protein [Gammaproteobacteria bacterium]